MDVQIGGKRKAGAKFLVVDDVPSLLSSQQTCKELELLSVKRELLMSSVSDVKALSKDVVLSEYNDVFTGLGYIGN